MKKQQKKKSGTLHRITHQTTSQRKTRYNKGALGAGMAYAILGILVIMAAGVLMIGSIVPKSQPNADGQPVIISTNTPQPKKSNLQLYDFPGATYTPTPTDTPTPTPTSVPHDSGGGSGGGNTCFPKGTKVLMGDNSQKNIEDIQVGDKVMGYNGKEKAEETVLQLESPIRDHLYKLSFADGGTLSLTREHPLFTSDGWKSISPESTAEENPNLKVLRLVTGDRVLKSNGSFIKIVSMQYIPGNVQTYNLKRVTGYNDFYVNSFLAHNKGGSGGGGSGVGYLPLN